MLPCRSLLNLGLVAQVDSLDQGGRSYCFHVVDCVSILFLEILLAGSQDRLEGRENCVETGMFRLERKEGQAPKRLRLCEGASLLVLETN
jgi:hypothetical protein